MQRKSPSRRDFLQLAASGGLSLGAPGAFAQATFPQRPMKVVVPFAPGTGSDVIARTVAQNIATSTRQPVLVENREGGSGIVGTMAVAQAPADGYTMLMVANPFTIVMGTHANPPYDALRDFAPVARVANVPIVLTITPGLGIETVQQLVAYAKANPGYASSGGGTPSQIEMELFKQAAGVDIVEVPYKSSAQAMTDVIGGQIAMYPAAMPLCLQHVRAGKVRALGLFDSQRSPLLPDVPHFAEALRVPGYAATPLWYGFVARAGAPRETMARLRELVLDAMTSAEVKDRLVALGAQPINPSNEEFTRQMAAEIEKSARIAKALGITK